VEIACRHCGSPAVLPIAAPRSGAGHQASKRCLWCAIEFPLADQQAIDNLLSCLRLLSREGAAVSATGPQPGRSGAPVRPSMRLSIGDADPRASRSRHPVWAPARARTNGTPGRGASRLLRIGARAIPAEALDLEHVPGSWTGSHVRGSPSECALRVSPPTSRRVVRTALGDPMRVDGGLGCSYTVGGGTSGEPRE